MKKYITILSMGLSALICACTGQKQAEEAGTKVYDYQDSCQNLTFQLSLELPSGEDSVSARIRRALVEDFIEDAEEPGFEVTDERPLKPFAGDRNDGQAVVNYYGKAAYDYLLGLALDDLEERQGFIKENTSISEEEREEWLANIPMWEYRQQIRKTIDTPRYVVYTSRGYAYYGGAHGGVTGSGAMTFNKATGKRVEQMVDPSATNLLQHAIRQGLIGYYGETGEDLSEEELLERLFIEDGIIPLPVQTPYPNATGDSLTFTYTQYEIACYADGMPTFTISVKDIMPCLTEEAKEILR